MFCARLALGDLVPARQQAEQQKRAAQQAHALGVGGAELGEGDAVSCGQREQHVPRSGGVLAPALRHAEEPLADVRRAERAHDAVPGARPLLPRVRVVPPRLPLGHELDVKVHRAARALAGHAAHPVDALEVAPAEQRPQLAVERLQRRLREDGEPLPLSAERRLEAGHELHPRHALLLVQVGGVAAVLGHPHGEVHRDRADVRPDSGDGGALQRRPHDALKQEQHAAAVRGAALPQHAQGASDEHVLRGSPAALLHLFDALGEERVHSGDDLLALRLGDEPPEKRLGERLGRDDSVRGGAAEGAVLHPPAPGHVGPLVREQLQNAVRRCGGECVHRQPPDLLEGAEDVAARAE